MAMLISGKKTALLVIDVQKAFEQIASSGLNRNNPNAEENIVELIKFFRSRKGEIIHIRHASTEPHSLFGRERSGFEVSACAQELPGETVVVKSVNSSFIGTNLEKILDEREIEALVVVGATTNHCVETTTRMAGNLGYDTYLVSDAIWTFDRIGIDGITISASDIHHMSLSNLKEEFATIVSTKEMLAA